MEGKEYGNESRINKASFAWVADIVSTENYKT
jgi:hypothetical protein